MYLHTHTHTHARARAILCKNAHMYFIKHYISQDNLIIHNAYRTLTIIFKFLMRKQYRN